MAKEKLTFDGKPLSVKFDNYVAFLMTANGLTYADFLIGEKSDVNKFCTAWASVLGIEFDGNARAFLARFNSLLGLNDAVISALYAAGILKPDGKDDKLKKNKSR